MRHSEVSVPSVTCHNKSVMKTTTEMLTLRTVAAESVTITAVAGKIFYA